MSDFQQFFQKAMGSCDGSLPLPHPYQARFASQADFPQLVRAPTAAGKTAAAVIGWLYRQQSRPKDVPRRLVYCLPMRVLVEQSERESRRWVANLKLDVAVYVLMGGVESAEWYLHPEQPAILIGTQDMLLSRALNRGYAASRFHWPVDFGLLNNDCVWVFDEPQLMANGVTTSAQIAGLRKALGTFGSCPSIWMSATLEPTWLETIDYAGKFTGKPLELGKDQYGDDYDPERSLYKRMTAAKTLVPLSKPSSKDMKEVAEAVVANHVDGTQTLVIVNTVERAKAVFTAITDRKKKGKKDHLHSLLIHSRFRLFERNTLNTQIQDKNEAKDRIIVATQVVEAGVDMSARTLITELAPWASIVQRIGRCNRTGDDGPGQVFWIDLDEKLYPPYAANDLDFARQQLRTLEDRSVSPRDLDHFKTMQKITLPFEHKHVLRRRDLLDLFDTAPDLSGNDIDIQRFVRSDDPETDMQVFWRDMTIDGWDVSPARSELCNVPVGTAKEFLKKGVPKGFVWDHIDDEWRSIRDVDLDVRPGQTILLPVSIGGYSMLGWDPDSRTAVTPIPPDAKEKEEAVGSDANSVIAAALTISQHSQHVSRELDEVLQVLHFLRDWSELLGKAARWHDVGKAHVLFQQGLRSVNPMLDENQLWAKSGARGRLEYKRKHFRHELASGLATLQQKLPFVVAYLVAAHHGRARLAIRALPGEVEPPTEDRLFALGIHDGDPLPAVEVGGEVCPGLTLDLGPMQLGGENSWTANALELLSELGPFKLAYLEAILRAADVRASKKEANNG